MTGLRAVHTHELRIERRDILWCGEGVIATDVWRRGPVTIWCKVMIERGWIRVGLCRVRTRLGRRRRGGARLMLEFGEIQAATVGCV